MVIAIATVEINQPDLPSHARDSSTREVIEVSAEAGDWEAAKAACEIPAGGMVLAWRQG